MPCPYTVTKRGAENVKATKKQMLVQHVLWLILSTKTENYIISKNLNHQHLHALPHNGIPRPHEVSPPISSPEATAFVVLHILGRLRLEEPLDHGIAAVEGCRVQRCFASGAAARGQATGRTQRNEGEKNSENIWGTSKVEVLEIVATQNPPWTWWTVCFWGSFDDIELVEKGHVNQIGNQNASLRKLKKCSVSKKTNMRAIGTQQNLKSVPCSRYFV